MVALSMKLDVVTDPVISAAVSFDLNFLRHFSAFGFTPEYNILIRIAFSYP